MFSVYLYLVLMSIILVILYITQDQILLSFKERKQKLENQTIQAVKCNNYYFSQSKNQLDY